MAKLVPTPIIDRNGKATTVHRRAGVGSAGVSPGLAAARPTVAPAHPAPRGDAPTTTIRPAAARDRAQFDRISCLWRPTEWARVLNGEPPYHWRKSPVTVPDAALYGYLRLGLELGNAAILHGAGITPEAAGQNEDLDGCLRWRVFRLDGSYDPDFSERGRAIDLLEESGVPAETAFKAIENGLTDYDFENTVLSAPEIAAVYANLPFKRSRQPVFDALRSGDIPWELTGTNTYSELLRLRREQVSDVVMWDEHDVSPESDRAAYLRGASVGLKRMVRPDQSYSADRPVSRMLTAYTLHGEEAFDAPQPDILLKQYRAEDGTKPYVDPAGARFAQAVLDLIGDRHDWGRGWLWQNSEAMRTNRLDHEALMQLRDAGATPQQAYDLLVELRLDAVRAVAVVRAGVPTALSDGAL